MYQGGEFRSQRNCGRFNSDRVHLRKGKNMWYAYKHYDGYFEAGPAPECETEERFVPFSCTNAGFGIVDAENSSEVEKKLNQWIEDRKKKAAVV